MADERKQLEAVWPGEELGGQMLASAHPETDAGCHLRALLSRVRDLERALAATGYFREPERLPAEGVPGRHDYFEAWLGAVEYAEGVDALLDQYEVPTKRDGKVLWLRERVEALGAAATERSQLAYELFKQLDAEYGEGLRGGNWPEIRPLWDRARAAFGVA